jgi:hypothetical protein
VELRGFVIAVPVAVERQRHEADADGYGKQHAED